MPNVDLSRPLRMARFEVAHGFRLNAGRSITVVDEPSKSGEISPDMAQRFLLTGSLVYEDDYSPTAIEAAPDAPERPADNVDGAVDEKPAPARGAKAAKA